jgi:hypothetical protein
MKQILQQINGTIINGIKIYHKLKIIELRVLAEKGYSNDYSIGGKQIRYYMNEEIEKSYLDNDLKELLSGDIRKKQKKEKGNG